MKVTGQETSTHFCERCGEKLDPKTMVWLELNTNTGRYHAESDPVPAAESQGSFTFGAACARKVIANGGKNVQIGRAKR